MAGCHAMLLAMEKASYQVRYSIRKKQMRLGWRKGWITVSAIYMNGCMGCVHSYITIWGRIGIIWHYVPKSSWKTSIGSCENSFDNPVMLEISSVKWVTDLLREDLKLLYNITTWSIWVFSSDCEDGGQDFMKKIESTGSDSQIFMIASDPSVVSILVPDFECCFQLFGKEIWSRSKAWPMVIRPYLTYMSIPWNRISQKNHHYFCIGCMALMCQILVG